MNNIRMCVSCKKRIEREKLIRLTVVDEQLVIDNEGKLQGRGFYICNDQETFQQIITRRKLYGKMANKYYDQLVLLLRKLEDEK